MHCMVLLQYFRGVLTSTYPRLSRLSHPSSQAFGSGSNYHCHSWRLGKQWNSCLIYDSWFSPSAFCVCTKCINSTTFIFTYDNCYKKIVRGNDPSHWCKCCHEHPKRALFRENCARVLWRSPLVHAQKTFISWTAMLAAFLHCKYLLPNMRSVMPPNPQTPQICAHQKPKNWRRKPPSVYCKTFQRNWTSACFT